ncbi:YhcN/YlaJ family sporulation lipoprotein [Microaerobacter geothermalis]|uniref:YhcN/YlaJ family sporulation lipoprotein n=1 Tax=Microaerobacter geothermalis TaxID=674972 RepID=UPI001F3AC186|nr:YhcN/YlaJ family sporulation lipoprotein [Microaerobacter geothermalis]MCF6093197.1 YhcN/YlaJ family sporulation lipoprotein [Microaerobacter geothermalis]
MHHKPWLLVVLAGWMVFALAACAPANQGALPENRDQVDIESPGNRYDVKNYNPNLFTAPGYKQNNEDLADSIADRVAKVRGVDDATVIISGGNVYVGLQVNDTVTIDHINRIENQARALVNQTLPGYDIYVSTDDSLFGRLRSIGNGMRFNDRDTERELTTIRGHMGTASRGGTFTNNIP